MMEDRRTTNAFNRKPWRYVYASLVAGIGVILFVLAYIIPGAPWLAWLGFAFILAAMYYVMMWLKVPFLHFKGWWEQDNRKS